MNNVNLTGYLTAIIIAYVPCVIVNPSKKEMNHLIKHGKGKYVELHGILHGHQQELNGQSYHVNEVCVDPTNMLITGKKR